MSIDRDALVKLYIEWANDYITIQKFAEHKGLTVEQALTLVKLAKEVFLSVHPDA